MAPRPNKRAEAAKQRRAHQARVTKGGAKPSPAQSSRAAKKTTSSGRGAGKTPTVDSRKQRQKVSNAKVTSSGGGSRGRGAQRVTQSASNPATGRPGPNKADASRWKQLNQSAKTSGRGPVKGAPGTEGAPTNAKPAARSAKGQITANKMSRALKNSAAARNAAAKALVAKGVAKGGARAVAAAAGINAGSVADGTLKGKATGPKQGPPAPKAKKDFGSAFKAARAQGKKEFTWNGKRYHTRRADGK